MITTDTKLHPTAKGYQDVQTTKHYVQGRPSYPLESIDFIKNELKLKSDSVIVDLAAGTGKFTSLLAEHGQLNNITAVEPSKEFRDSCEEILSKYQTTHPEFKFSVVDGLATSIPVESGSVDCVFAAQAFHWFSNLESVKEISRVLKPGGVFCMFWNDLDITDPLIKELTDIFHEKYYDGKTPQYRSNKWQQVFQELKSLNDPTLIQGDLNKKEFSFKHPASIDVAINRALSVSYISVLPQEKKDQIVSELKEVLENHPTSSNGKPFSMPYNLSVYWTFKK
eukprot:gene6206-7728_t